MQALNSAPQEVFEEVKQTVLSNAENFSRDGKVYVNWEAIVTTGIKK